VAANTARDVGGRLAAMAIWGTKANGGRYAAIAALTNILATVLAYAFYEFVLKDSSRRTLHMIVIFALLVFFLSIPFIVLTAAEKEFYHGRAAGLEHRERYLGSGSGFDSEKSGVGVEHPASKM
jgi:ACR3 family arsenite efflux pump ArsB